jgi:hypothetical protein
MKRILATVAATVLVCAGAARSEVVTVQVASTGFDSNGNLLADLGGPDANYTITSGPDAFAATTSAPGTWLGTDNLSEWITPLGGATGATAGEFDYTTSFNLTGLDTTTFALLGKFTTDNEILHVLLNGNDLGTFGNAGDFTQFGNFNVDQTNAAGDFNAGVNTLTFQVNNDPFDAANPSGLRVEVTSATASTPEPGTLGMFGIGAASLLIGMVRRNRNRKAGRRA